MLLACAGLALGQSPANSDAEVDLIRAGIELQVKVAGSRSTAEARALLEQSSALFRAALGKKANSTVARFGLAECAVYSGRLADSTEERQRHMRAAIEQFNEVLRSPDMDWQACARWVELLEYDMDSATYTPESLRLVMEHARSVCETGLTLARFNNQRVRLQYDLGICLTHLAFEGKTAEERRERFKQSTAVFEAAKALHESPMSAESAISWGTALTELGKLDHDPAFFRKALTQLTAALETNPGEPRILYQLACVHALLQQPDEALRRLQQAFEGDAGGNLRKIALQDTDLESLRQRAAFRDLLDAPAHPATAKSLLKEGKMYHQQAKQMAANGGGASLFDKAIAQYGEAVRRQPDYYEAQLAWALALYEMARLSLTPVEHKTLIQEARQRYQTASNCPGADWQVYHQWGGLLLSEADILAVNADSRRAVLTEARRHFQDALERARFSADLSHVRVGLGGCLVRLSEISRDWRERDELCRQAAEIFETVHREKPDVLDGNTYGLWGTALLERAKLSNDRTMLRLAIDRLKASVAADPANSGSFYNLACCSVIIELPEAAMGYLRQCFDQDKSNSYRKLAATDPDLKTLRRYPEFDQLTRPPKNN